VSLIPLFPLEVVLFPGMPLPLHIFEPRYKEMMGELLQNKQLFGVVRAKENSISEVGCTAEIVAVTKRYDDGQLDIVTEGRERFEIVRVDTGRSFLRGEVLFLKDEANSGATEEVKELIGLHQQAMQLLDVEGEAPEPDDQLSFQLAGALPFDLDFKQTLLGMRSEPARISALLQYYRAIIPDLRRAAKARKKAGGNGHV